MITYPERRDPDCLKEIDVKVRDDILRWIGCEDGEERRRDAMRTTRPRRCTVKGREWWFTARRIWHTPPKTKQGVEAGLVS